MFLVGPNTYFPLNAFSKKQTVVANSSIEAEVVSANHALRAEGIPMLALMEQLGIFKKLAQKAGVKTKPGDPEPEDPVFTRIDKEIDEIRYGNVEGGLSASNINSVKHQQLESPFSRVLQSEVHGGQSSLNHGDGNWKFINNEVCQ